MIPKAILIYVYTVSWPIKQTMYILPCILTTLLRGEHLNICSLSCFENTLKTFLKFTELISNF